MTDSGEPPPTAQPGDSPNAHKQITHRPIDAAPSRSTGAYLRSFWRAIAGSRTSLARGLISLATLSTGGSSVRAFALVGLTVAGMAVFFGPIGAPLGDSNRLDAIELAVKRIETSLAAPGLSRTHVANPTSLLVAVQFVTAAAERSTPFDTALAVAISMIGEHPKIGPLLDQLLVEAVTGVPSVEDLRREFQAKLGEFEKDGLFTDIGSSASQSAFRLSRFLGLADSEISDEHRATLQQVSVEVTGQELGQAVQRVAKLDGRLREGLESWREKAQRRVAVDLVSAELRRAAFIDLIDEAS